MTVLIGNRYRSKLEKTLNDLVNNIIWMPDDPDANEKLANHADLNIFTPDEYNLFISEGIYSDIVNYLTKIRAEKYVIKGKKRDYPYDCGLCLCNTGKYIIYNPKTSSEEINIFLSQKSNLIPVCVNQGYTKCSVCIVAKSAIITSDEMIASKAACKGLDVLQIIPGHILLEGYNYGFIGGSSFLIDSKTMAFTGRLDLHPDKQRIMTFIAKYNVKPVFLTNDPLFDIGSAITLP